MAFLPLVMQKLNFFFSQGSTWLIPVREDSPFFRMAHQFKRPQREAQELGYKAARMLEATRSLKAQ